MKRVGKIETPAVAAPAAVARFVEGRGHVPLSFDG